MTTTSTVPEQQTPQSPPVGHLLALETPCGRPVRWAEVAVVTDIGDSHEFNDDRCLVLTSSQLGKGAAGAGDFLLCLLADGATGSTFGQGGAVPRWNTAPQHAGWRASQLAQGAFVESFLSSAEVDVLDRLKEGLRAADRALTDSPEGTLSTTLVALYVSSDGMAYAASIGDSVLLALPPRRKSPGDRRLKKLGYEDSTSVGSGDTTLSSGTDADCIEQWWPHKEGGGSSMRVEPGTYLVLMSDGISDNLPVEFIDQLLHRHRLDRATVGLPYHTRKRRVETQKQSGGSTQHLGLDNMSAIVVRFDGGRGIARREPGGQPGAARLVTVLGTYGGPAPDAGGQFGLICLAEAASALRRVPSFLRRFIESEHAGEVDERLAIAVQTGAPPSPRSAPERFAVLAVDDTGQRSTFASGGAQIGPGTELPVRIARRVVTAARETPLQRLVRTPSIWGPAIAAIAVLFLVSTAFATGTVRPAPPAAPTARPGEPRPTPDTRPSLSIGGFVLQPPVQPKAVPVQPGLEQKQDPPLVDGQPAPAPAVPADVEPTPPAEAGCANLLAIGCDSTSTDQGSAPAAPQPPAPALPVRRATAPGARVVPVPSPAAVPDESLDDLHAATSAPPRGSRLESALQGASQADENFAREVGPASREQQAQAP